MILRFQVVDRLPHTPSRDTVYLLRDNWDDFHFETLFGVNYVGPDAAVHELGGVKVGQRGLQAAARSQGDHPGLRRPDLAQRFTTLGQNQFSVGQDREYYEGIDALGREFAETYLAAMNDLVLLDDEELQTILLEEVTRISLLRSVSIESIRNQFRRIARGGPAVVSYEISYTVSRAADPVELTFSATPDLRPPTNVHVLIGSNGVGKSTILNDMARALVGTDEPSFAPVQGRELSNVVTISFSAFDTFDSDLPDGTRRPEPGGPPFDLGNVGLTYRRVGLPLLATVDSRAERDPMVERVREATGVCLSQPDRKNRLIAAIERLESDPILREVGISDWIRTLSPEDVVQRLTQTFPKLSSGHKIVLLGIANLVDTVEEASLVLLDEPESHLHPPLLSAYIRALSDLLVDRNGLAIVATHSPVVLQEVPRSCVWMIRRFGEHLAAERPGIETFGENLGVLTDQIFGREVSKTGYHQMLAEAVRQHNDYDAVLADLGDQLGIEGRAILRTMINHHVAG